MFPAHEYALEIEQLLEEIYEGESYSWANADFAERFPVHSIMYGLMYYYANGKIKKEDITSFLDGNYYHIEKDINTMLKEKQNASEINEVIQDLKSLIKKAKLYLW